MTEWIKDTVLNLQAQGILRVEDGNHGEYRPRTDEFCARGVAFIRAADMANGAIDFVSASKINDTATTRITKGIGRPGDILISHKGTVGKIARAPANAPPFVCSPQTTFWRSTNEDVLSQDFLYVLIRSPAFMRDFLVSSGETDMAGYVSLTSQRRLRLSLPPISLQRSVSDCISAFDYKIALNRKMNATLEAMARALFRDWFVDFGPTRAKMEGRAPTLSPDLWSLFPDQLDDEGKPEGWERAKLGAVTSELRRGVSPKYTSAGGVMVLNQKCIRNREVETALARFHDNAQKDVASRLIQAGDILVNSTGMGTLGRVAQLWKLHNPMIVDSHVTVVRADFNMVSRSYLGVALTEREAEIEALGEGSTGQTELSRARLAELDVLLPNLPLQAAFDSLAVPFLDRMEANREESRTLAQTRDLLLPRLMSGELRVAEVERVLEATI